MPFDTLGGTRATLDVLMCHVTVRLCESPNMGLKWDSALQFSDLN